MKPTMKATLLGAAALTLFASTIGRAVPIGSEASARSASTDERVRRGAYLVEAMSCNDCHTPWKLGPKGPAPDRTRLLSGHPADLVMPPPPKVSGPWGWIAAATNTAFAGPWGVSFTANLTPDPETGLGKWTPEMFMATMKTGRHQGKGRPLLPPMPYFSVAALTDDDMRAVFAYLQSLPPIKNRVPNPIDPPEDAK
jgi:mono/diheme cytochrome c family protein